MSKNKSCATFEQKLVTFRLSVESEEKENTIKSQWELKVKTTKLPHNNNNNNNSNDNNNNNNNNNNNIIMVILLLLLLLILTIILI